VKHINAGGIPNNAEPSLRSRASGNGMLNGVSLTPSRVIGAGVVLLLSGLIYVIVTAAPNQSNAIRFLREWRQVWFVEKTVSRHMTPLEDVKVFNPAEDIQILDEICFGEWNLALSDPGTGVWSERHTACAARVGLWEPSMRMAPTRFGKPKVDFNFFDIGRRGLSVIGEVDKDPRFIGNWKRGYVSGVDANPSARVNLHRNARQFDALGSQGGRSIQFNQSPVRVVRLGSSSEGYNHVQNEQPLDFSIQSIESV
jgi:hypothetical protein